MIKQFYLFLYKPSPNGQARMVVYAGDETQAVEKAKDKLRRSYGELGPSLLCHAGNGFVVKQFATDQEANLGIGPGASLLSSLDREDSMEYLTDRDAVMGEAHLTPQEKEVAKLKAKMRSNLFDQQCKARLSDLREQEKEDARRERPVAIDRDAHDRPNEAGISSPQTSIVVAQ